MTTQCFRIKSGARSATCDISGLSDDTLYGLGVIAGPVRILFDGDTLDSDGVIVTANYFDDDIQQSLVDFEGPSEDHCGYAEDFAEEYAIEISRRLVRRENGPHIIATQQDVERAADACWAV
jgi:hypothetical protein